MDDFYEDAVQGDLVDSTESVLDETGDQQDSSVNLPISEVPSVDLSDSSEEAPLVDLSDSSEEVPPVDQPPQEDSSVSDLLDSFLAGALAGSASAPTEDSSADVPAELVGIETYSLSPITSSSGLKGVLLDVLGPYDTVVTQYKYQQGSNQYYSYVNDIQPDYPWLASAALFIVLIWSLFSLLRRSLSTWLK